MSVVVLLILLLGCGAAPVPSDDAASDDTAIDDGPSLEEIVAEAVASAMSDPVRSETDLADDANRKPGEVLRFFGIAPGMQVLDLLAGGGYYTEIVSKVVGGEGSVLFHNNEPYRQFVGEAIAARTLDGRLSNVSSLDVEVADLTLEPGELDAVIFILGFHDLYYASEDGSWPDIDETALLAILYEGLAPSGILGVVDHAAQAGADPFESGSGPHRIDEEVVRRDAEAAGFVLEASSEVLRNPDDERSISVFDEAIRRRTDRFVLKFRKPA
jgi:predicted methyltransferase